MMNSLSLSLSLSLSVSLSVLSLVASQSAQAVPVPAPRRQDMPVQKKECYENQDCEPNGVCVPEPTKECSTTGKPCETVKDCQESCGGCAPVDSLGRCLSGPDGGAPGIYSDICQDDADCAPIPINGVWVQTCEKDSNKVKPAGICGGLNGGCEFPQAQCDPERAPPRGPIDQCQVALNPGDNGREPRCERRQYCRSQAEAKKLLQRLEEQQPLM